MRLKDRIQAKLTANKLLIQNFSYLSAIQLLNMLIPLITYPYLIRVVGMNVYGLVVFAQAVVGYLIILVGFGFHISATKEISIYREDKEKLSEIFSSVLIIKSGLLLLAFLILGCLIFIIPEANENKSLFFLSMWGCIYDLLFPIWYFQGIERMKYITYITLISRLIFLVLIFVLIHSSDDFLLIPIINGVGAIIAGSISLYIILVRHRIQFKFQSFKKLKFYFDDSVLIFISNMSSSLYINTNKIILGSFFSMSEVAIYDLAEKLTNLMKMPIQLFGQTIYPKIVKSKDLNFLVKSFKFSLFMASGIYIISTILAPFIIKIVGGNNLILATPVFRILIISIIPVLFSLFLNNLILIPWGFNKEYFKTRLFSNTLYIIIITSLIYFKEINMYLLSATYVITEMSVASIAYYYVKSKKIFIGL